MHKLIGGSLCLALAITSFSFASFDSDNSNDQIISLSELTRENIEEFFLNKDSSFILECSKGTILPLHLSLESEFLSLGDVERPYTVQVLKTCYIKCIDETFFFSSDLLNWKEFEKFFTGTFGVSLNLNEDQNPEVGLHLGLHERTHLNKQ
jgi:hypothetical protein